MMEVSACVVGAGVASAALNERREIPLEAGVGDVETPIGGVDSCITRHARRVDAVEGVRPCGHTRKEILRLGNTEQMTWTILAQLLADPRHDGAEIFLFKSTADAKSVKALAVHFHVGHRARG